MSYRVSAAHNPSAALASCDLDDDFAAEQWAREWAVARGTAEDYIIERPETGYSASLFRTTAGQWYIMRSDNRSAHHQPHSSTASLETA